jgi:hypothetical protein
VAANPAIRTNVAANDAIAVSGSALRAADAAN